MPLELGMFDVMEYLWEKLDKTPDGRIRYSVNDIEALWIMGFVDAQKYPMAQWKGVFEPFRAPDGSYFLEKDAFLSLDKYRYKGEIHIPFDAMKINEGFYTDEGLQELIDASIAPSSCMPPDRLRAFFAELKELFRAPDGLIKIGRDAKLKIRDLIDKNPSPIRNLEILFDQMLRAGDNKGLEDQIASAQTERVTAQAALEASSFAATPITKAEASAKGLKGIEKARRKTSATRTGGEGVALKKIRRSRKGMRG